MSSSNVLISFTWLKRSGKCVRRNNFLKIILLRHLLLLICPTRHLLSKQRFFCSAVCKVLITEELFIKSEVSYTIILLVIFLISSAKATEVHSFYFIFCHTTDPSQKITFFHRQLGTYRCEEDSVRSPLI